MFTYNTEKRGFTLIELLVVIAIIGILSSVVLASLNSARQKSRDARRVSDIGQVQLALELYFDTNGEYPEALAALATGNFIAQAPKDPVTDIGYFYNAYTTATEPPVVGDDCTEASEVCIFYHLGANLEQAGHAATKTDADLTGDVVDGDDADGCASVATTEHCYDIVP